MCVNQIICKPLLSHITFRTRCRFIILTIKFFSSSMWFLISVKRRETHLFHLKDQSTECIKNWKLNKNIFFHNIQIETDVFELAICFPFPFHSQCLFLYKLKYYEIRIDDWASLYPSNYYYSEAEKYSWVNFDKKNIFIFNF